MKFYNILVSVISRAFGLTYNNGKNKNDKRKVCAFGVVIDMPVNIPDEILSMYCENMKHRLLELSDKVKINDPRLDGGMSVSCDVAYSFAVFAGSEKELSKI